MRGVLRFDAFGSLERDRRGEVVEEPRAGAKDHSRYVQVDPVDELSVERLLDDACARP